VCRRRGWLPLACVTFALVFIPPSLTGCKKSRGGLSHEGIVLEAIASLNRSADAAGRVNDTASARQAEQRLRAEARALRELREKLVALGRPSGGEKRRVNRHSQQLIDASESIKRAIASMAAKQLSGQVERDVAIQLAKACVDHGEAMKEFAQTAKPMFD
jgi:hypothetical protein